MSQNNYNLKDIMNSRGASSITLFFMLTELNNHVNYITYLLSSTRKQANKTALHRNTRTPGFRFQPQNFVN